MKEELRPREKALRNGIQSLSDLDLLALLISSGTKNHTVFEIAQDMLVKSDGLNHLFDMHINEFMEIKGIREAKALQIVGSIELCKRALRTQAYQTTITCPNDVIRWFELEYGTLQQEHFVVVYLNTKGKIITHRVLFIGSLDESIVHPRDIFKEAFLQNAHSVLFVHNHPSNDVTPSVEDRVCTEQLVAISKVMGIQVLDHIIVGKNCWYSFKQEGELC